MLLLPSSPPQRDAISNPVVGSFIYNISTNCFNGYNGTDWVAFGCPTCYLVASAGADVTITIGNNNYGYDEISSLTMWKTNPKIAWGFKANFYNIMNHSIPHKGYYNLLKFVSNKLQNNYFVCTSNIDNYFDAFPGFLNV